MGRGFSENLSPYVGAPFAEDRAVVDGRNPYVSVDRAVETGNSVLVGPGTYDETVVIDQDNVTVRGVGRGTKIDGGSGSAIIVRGDDVTLESIAVKNDLLSGSKVVVVEQDPRNLTIRDMAVTVADGGIALRSATLPRLVDVTAEVVDDYAVTTTGSVSRARIRGLTVYDGSGPGINDSGQITTITEPQIGEVAGHGIYSDGTDTQVVSGQIIGVDNNGVEFAGDNQMIEATTIKESGGSNLVTANATGVTQGDAVVLGSASVLEIYSAEDPNKIGDYFQDDPGEFDTSTDSSLVVSGDRALIQSGDAFSRIYSVPGGQALDLPNYFPTGENARFAWEVDSLSFRTSVMFGTDSTSDTYQARYEPGNGQFRVIETAGGQNTDLGTSAVSLSTDTRYWWVPQRTDNGDGTEDLTVDLEDDGGTVLGSVSALSLSSLHGYEGVGWISNADSTERVATDYWHVKR